MPGQPFLHDLVTVLSAPTVALSEPDGQIRTGGAQGLLHADMRVLSRAELRLGGAELEPIGGSLRGAHAAVFSSVPRQLGDDSSGPVVRVDRARTVAPGLLSEQITVHSYAGAGLRAELSVHFAADLAGVALIKDGLAAAQVPIQATGPELRWGTPQLQVTLKAPGAELAAEPGGGVLRWQVALDGRGSAEFGWRLSVRDQGAVVRAAGGGSPWRSARASADDPRLGRLLAQSLADLGALRMASQRAPEDAFLAAGAPWFLTMFGRDSLWAARLLLPFGWQAAAGTLRALAAYQGRRSDPVTAEEPGKIPHELRRPGRATAGSLPPVYYGTIDATPLWICLLHDAWRFGMPADQVRALLPALRGALGWMREHGDADGDGFLEYIDSSGRGLANQGWKDSGDSVRFASGRIAVAPVALCEVQGYACEAARHGADLLDALGEPGGAHWRDWADRLAAAFRDAFWVDDGGGAYPALALDRDKQPVDALTSNIGHLLGTGLLSQAEEALVAARLAGPDLDSGFGLRTMSAGAGGYSPLSYHCGTVWSHDTAIAIRGLAAAGHPDAAASLADGLLEAAAWFGWRLPELYSGDPRAAAPGPAPYPAACRPQAWAAAAAGALVQARLGLTISVPDGQVELAPPPVPIGGAGLRVHVDGLVAGEHTFSAGVDQAGQGYIRDLRLQPVR
ncbi:MAG TPA: glycogen debranching N-terminal domain-containing protein [Streptosporangiaceae bacterium]